LVSHYQSHHDAAMLVSVNEDTIAYFKAHRPGISVWRIELSKATATAVYESLPEPFETFCDKMYKSIRPHSKDSGVVILEDGPGVVDIAPVLFDLRFPHLILGRTLDIYGGTRSYSAVGSRDFNQVVVPRTPTPACLASHEAINTVRCCSDLEPMTNDDIDSYLESITADSSVIRALVLPAAEKDTISMISLVDDPYGHLGCSFDFLI
jgi:hypothetical protein